MKWEDRKEAYNKIFNSVLKEKMIIEVQRLWVTYTKGEKDICVSNFCEIGRVWNPLKSAEWVNSIRYGMCNFIRTRDMNSTLNETPLSN